MIKSNFLKTLKKIIDKIDDKTLKNLSIEIAEENQELKTVFNSMKEAVIVLDKDMKVIFYNKIAINILEITVKNLINMNITDVVNNKLFIETIKDSIKKQEGINDLELLYDNNYQKYISISLNPLVKNGEISGSIIIINDVTSVIENKKKLRQAESLAALTTISAGIAHEIKNPLGAMGIHVQLLERELNENEKMFSNDVKYSVNVIKNEIDRLNKIVVDYLMTVRPLKVELIPVNLQVFLNDFINFIEPEIRIKGINLKKSFANLPNVYIDEKYFKQALLNLVKNSIESIKTDGFIEIEAFQEKNYVIINIIDNGKGVSAENKPKIFDPYFTSKNTGTGLGLTIVYKIIKDHNGEIKFTSNEKRTTFSIKLPLTYIDKGLIEYSGAGFEY